MRRLSHLFLLAALLGAAGVVSTAFVTSSPAEPAPAAVEVAPTPGYCSVVCNEDDATPRTPCTDNFTGGLISCGYYVE